MKRRSFLKLLGFGVAAAAVDPLKLLSVAPAPEVAPVVVEPAAGFMVYDLLPPARFIYPVLLPTRNRMRRSRTA